jgi:hypothetical protein
MRYTVHNALIARDFSRLPQSFMANATTMFNKMQSSRILDEVITGLPLHVKLPISDDM